MGKHGLVQCSSAKSTYLASNEVLSSSPSAKKEKSIPNKKRGKLYDNLFLINLT
jgi:hypothetical protein